MQAKVSSPLPAGRQMPPFRHGLPAQGVEAVDINRVYRRAWDYMDDYMILNMTQIGSLNRIKSMQNKENTSHKMYE